jgi:hypothetical protein
MCMFLKICGPESIFVVIGYKLSIPTAAGLLGFHIGFQYSNSMEHLLFAVQWVQIFFLYMYHIFHKLCPKVQVIFDFRSA